MPNKGILYGIERGWRRRMGMEERSGFFAGLEFTSFCSNRVACGCAKAHPRFYGVQYIHSGAVYLSVNGGPEYLLKGPVAFLTSP